MAATKGERIFAFRTLQTKQDLPARRERVQSSDSNCSLAHAGQSHHDNMSIDNVALRNSATLVVGAIAAQVIGGLFAQMSPLVVAGLMDGLALSEREAGIVTSVELLALAITAILIAPVLPRLSYRRVCIGAVTLTLLAQGASIVAGGWTTLIMLRTFAGLGEGALYASSLSIVASRANNPEKVYGYFQLVWALGSVPLFSAGGEITAAFAHQGIFALLGGVTLTLAPVLLLLPNTAAPAIESAMTDRQASSSSFGMMLFIAIFLYMTVAAAQYAFSTSMGERAGLDTAAVGYTLTIATLVGLAGAAAAMALNVRWGRVFPISLFCFAYAVTAAVLCLWQNPTVFVVALVLAAALYYFSLPYLFGLAAAIDRSGRWAAAAGSAYLLGFAAGPFLGGAVIASSGYMFLAASIVALMAASWGLLMVIANRVVDRRVAEHQSV
ncbi:MFS transporter [Rhizobium mongolense]|uniref:Putative MFS family arabinose efflux permease n=1 Tax=Rhizobium mongolense TaxID=57676 RepID=A0A7W6RIG0_9HYPH|nr:MFS transporter [Rhizobium mongolense]MBB4272879.1 putative MFS family arabinose efflux permease [Rhizobium mongolense]